MPPRGRGRGHREREQLPVRGRGRGRGSPTCEGYVTRTYVAAPPLPLPQTRGCPLSRCPLPRPLGGMVLNQHTIFFKSTIPNINYIIFHIIIHI